jgi:hypothetical protein
MQTAPLAVVLVVVAFGAAGCSARAIAPMAEPEIPSLEPPPAPPRIVAVYPDPPPPVPLEATATVPPSAVLKPQPRPTPPPPTQEPARESASVASPPPALTLTPAPGIEAKTEASIRVLLGRASSDLARVNGTSLNADGRTQLEAARRFVQQAEEALKARNLVFAGKLADKAVAMAAVLVR